MNNQVDMFGGGGGDQGGKRDGPQHALSILPKNVWKQVFANLKSDPHSLQSLSKTCRVFQRILEELEPPTRMDLWIDKVIDLLECWNWLTSTWLKKFRLLTLDKQETLESVLPALQNGTFWNKRFIKVLHVKLPMDNSFEQNSFFLLDALGLLPLLQNNLTMIYLDMTWRCLLGTYIEAYDILGLILNALPKLKEVVTHFYFTPVLTRLEEKERVIQFNKHVALNPLPVAKNLTGLEIKMESVPLAFLVEISARYGGTLEDLRINQDKILEEVSVAPDNAFLEFPRLKKLTFFISFGIPEVILLIKAPSLKALCLTMKENFRYEQNQEDEVMDKEEPLEQALQILDSFLGITDLTLDLRIDPNVDHGKIIQRNLHRFYPSVHKLFLKRWKYRVPLSFFAKLFPNTRILSVQATIKENPSMDIRLKEDPDLLLIYQENLEESGLWRKLPQLAHIYTLHPVGPTLRNYRAGRLQSCSRPKEMRIGEKREVDENRYRKWAINALVIEAILAIISLVVGLLLVWLAIV